jgi:hypothetical protein
MGDLARDTPDQGFTVCVQITKAGKHGFSERFHFILGSWNLLLVKMLDFFATSGQYIGVVRLSISAIRLASTALRPARN